MNTYQITYRFMNAGLNTIEKEASTEKKARRALFDQVGSRHITIIDIRKI